MKKLEELRAALKIAEADVDKKAEAVKAEGATNDHTKALEDAMDEVDRLKAEIKTAERLEKQIAERSEDPKTPTKGSEKKLAAEVLEKMPAMTKVGHALVGLMKSNQEGNGANWRGAADMMDKDGYGSVAAEFDQRNKSMNSVTGSAGGFAVPEDFNEEIYESLKPYTTFLRGGPQVIPMPRGNYRQSGVAARPSAAYRAEGAAIAVSQPTLLDINMSAKLLSGMVPLTNQIIRYTSERAATMAQRELAAAMGIAMNAAMFEGTGAGNTPLGIYAQTGVVVSTDTNNTAPTQAQVDAAVRPMINAMMLYAILNVDVAWVMPQRVKGYLEDLTDGNGNYIYPDLRLESPRWKGFPVLVDGTIIQNGGVGTNETTLGLVSFGNILLGETGGLRINISDVAAWVDAGNTTSSFQNDSTLIRGLMEHDVQSRYAEAVLLLDEVKWGG